MLETRLRDKSARVGVVGLGLAGTAVPAGETPNSDSHVANDSAVLGAGSLSGSLGPSLIVPSAHRRWLRRLHTLTTAREFAEEN